MFNFITITQQSSIPILIYFLTYQVHSLNICEDCTKYPMCNFEPIDPSRHCIDYEITIKNKKDRQDILDKINNRRDKVASGDIRSFPSAGNMMKMEWNERLEMAAQRWANQCVPYQEVDSKDVCRLTDNINIVQNIATIVGDLPGLSPAILVDVWYMELLNINSTFVSRYRPTNQTQNQHFDYFTQLIWAQSHQVGCGGIKFKEVIAGKGRNKTINRLVCNFAPEGNQAGQPVYINGFPCSECPYDAICDSIYPSLCSFTFKMDGKEIYKAFENIKNINPFNKQKVTSNDNIKLGVNVGDNTNVINASSIEIDENATTFDYFANFFRSVIATEKATTTKVITCKDIMPVEDFIEVFKKRLMKDRDLKEFLLTSKTAENKEISDNSYTDVSVANFVNQIYSKKEILTTIKATEPDYSNSTLLADLVEAVIFKNNDKISTESEEQNTNFMSDVSVIKIKAELGKAQINSYSTGHYFFPVEYDEDVRETTEMFYDISSMAVSDLASEIEELRRNKGTKDFLEEILESESNPDTVSRSDLPSTTNYFPNENGNRNYFTKDERSDDSLEDSTTTVEKKSLQRRKRSEEMKTKILSSSKLKKSGFTTELINYRELLKKIAKDIGILKLNERFHCAGKSPPLCYLKIISLIFCIVIAFKLIKFYV